MHSVTIIPDLTTFVYSLLYSFKTVTSNNKKNPEQILIGHSSVLRKHGSDCYAK